MAIVKLPVRADLPAYDFLIELDGTNYGFRFHFNGRLNRWIMDVTDTAGNDIIAGIPVLTNVDLLGRFQMTTRPPGKFLAYDESGNAMNAGRYDLGQSVVLLYEEALV